MRHWNGRRGNSLVEFTLVGIPVIFLLISIFEMSRGMWMYHTLAHAVREGVRFTVVRGNDCNLPPNNCAATIGAIATRIRDAAVGLPPADLINVTFRSPTRTITCATLAACLSSGTYWPASAPGAAADSGGQPVTGWVEISAQYRFRSMIAMFWPGASPVTFGTVTLPASSRQTILH